MEEIAGVPAQLTPTPGMPERTAVRRRQARVREILHTLPPAAQEAILDELDNNSGMAVQVPARGATPDYGD